MIYQHSITTGPAKTGLRIGEGSLSYPHLFVPVASKLNPERKYSTDFLIPKTNTEALAVIRTAIANATARGLEKYWNGKKPQVFNDDLLKDGDLPDKDGLVNRYTKGCYVLKASSNEANPPRVYDGRDESVGAVPMTENDTELIHGGSKGYLIGTAAPYDTPAKKGVKIYLSGFVLTDTGEIFGDNGTALAEALAPDVSDW